MTVENRIYGRKRGSINQKRELPELIHPEQRLNVEDMATLSCKSKSYFYTNSSLKKSGLKHSSLPPLSKLGRNVVCRAGDFFVWLNSDMSEV